jgi:hypothetical protein
VITLRTGFFLFSAASWGCSTALGQDGSGGDRVVETSVASVTDQVVAGQRGTR